jgi:DNA polymerase-3 subunit gamma/tau
MAYLTLYRKYRPQTFDELVGQEHVARTIKNAFDRDQISHAYLFTGPRGTGKTTTARLIAKALNCEKGPTPNPCNECERCRAITEGSSLDVQEIDGASNRRIDDIRQLRENVKYVAAEGGWKVYVIDEVHMLVDEAFNALLKTLEEPPPKVIFVLCTTHPHEIPPTIISRCQRFDFRRGRIKDIVDRLKFVCSHEGIEADDAALILIAREADGSFRDSLSLLEQVTTFCGKRIAGECAGEVLGTVSHELLQSFVEAVSERDLKAAFALSETLVAEGVDIPQYLKSLSSYARDLLVVKTAGHQPDDIAPDEMQSLTELAKSIPRETLIRIIEEANQAEQQCRWNDQHRIVLELGMARLCEAQPGQPTADSRQPTADLRPEHGARGTEQRAQHEEPVARSPEHAAAPRAAAASAAKAKVDDLPDPFAVPEEKPEAPEIPQKAAQPVSGELKSVIDAWPGILAGLQQQPGQGPRAYLMLRNAKPIEVRGDTLVLGYNPRRTFKKEQIETPKVRALIEAEIAKAIPGITKMKAEIIEGLKEDEAPPLLTKDPADSGQLIDKALEMFDGRIVD